MSSARPSSTLGRILRSASFRLTLFYAALFIASAGALFATVYVTATAAMQNDMAAVLRSEAFQLAEVHSRTGLSGLAQQITRRMNFRTRGPIFYLLQAPNGRVVVGNLPGMPPVNGVVDFVPQGRHAGAGSRRRAHQAHRLRPHPVRRLVPAGRPGRRAADRHAARHRARLRLGGRAHACCSPSPAARCWPIPSCAASMRSPAPTAPSWRATSRRAFPCAARTTRSTSSSPASTPCWAASSSSWTGCARCRATSPTICARRSAVCASTWKMRASGPRPRPTTTPRPRPRSPKPTSSWKPSRPCCASPRSRPARRRAPSPSSISRPWPAASARPISLPPRIPATSSTSASRTACASPAIASCWRR